MPEKIRLRQVKSASGHPKDQERTIRALVELSEPLDDQAVEVAVVSADESPVETVVADLVGGDDPTAAIRHQPGHRATAAVGQQESDAALAGRKTKRIHGGTPPRRELVARGAAAGPAPPAAVLRP